MKQSQRVTLCLVSGVLVLLGCVGAGSDNGGDTGSGDGRKPGKSGGKKAASKRVLPAGFAVVGRATVVKRRLPPQSVWRWLESTARNELLRAHEEAEDRLLTLESSSVSLTDRAGARTVWPLPDGLRLQGGPIHLVLGKDLRVTLWRPDGTQVPPAQEITVVRAAFGASAKSSGELKSLVVKEGRDFQTISNSG